MLSTLGCFENAEILVGSWNGGSKDDGSPDIDVYLHIENPSLLPEVSTNVSLSFRDKHGNVYSNPSFDLSVEVSAGSLSVSGSGAGAPPISDPPSTPIWAEVSPLRPLANGEFETMLTGKIPASPLRLQVRVNGKLVNVNGADFEVRSPRLAFTGNSQPSAAPPNRRISETDPSWVLTGECENEYGLVDIKGLGLRDDFSVPCQMDNTFSASIDYWTPDSAFPSFTSPQGTKNVSISQEPQHEHKAFTWIYKIATSWQVNYIYNAFELQALVPNDPNKFYVLANDIEFTGTNNWTPLATGANFFRGMLDGNGHRIKGLDITSLAELGFIHRCQGCQISNLTFDSISFDYRGSTEPVAVVTSNCQNGEIENVHVINSTIEGKQYTGGLIGKSNGNCKVAHSSVQYSSITGDTYSTGGLVGEMGNTPSSSQMYYSFIKNSSVTGLDYVGGAVGKNIGGTLNGIVVDGVTVNGEDVVGGLVGASSSGTISNAHFIGTVTATGLTVGGIAGSNSGVIELSIAEGNISGGTNVGGLVGENSSQIFDSLAKGSVSGTDRIGGLVGSGWGPIERCVADTEITSSTNGGTIFGGISGPSIIDTYYRSSNSCTSCSSFYGTAVTDTDWLTIDTFIGLDFANSWFMTPAGPHPRLD
ncbi:MAG: hypothetical protein H6626_02285 [Pseudobdellovibrionaceae bacterium]|nr:hypothetical protein [Bdellovibrionales bacterium]USN47941.1 MAG: hypothetical protein H6626_02285 [Pseudobdellovibrionaceae bacterium]